MSFSKKIRKMVYDKYDGHCAYCGDKIDIKDMQIDHFIPKDMEPVVIAGNFPGLDSIDDFQNLMPACRMCNHYKRAHSLYTFRRYIREIPRKCRENYIYKIGIKYGLIEDHERNVRFYFEQFHGEKVPGMPDRKEDWMNTSGMKTAYFLDKDLDVYTAPLKDDEDAMKFANKHGLEFVGFVKAKDVLKIIEERDSEL